MLRWIVRALAILVFAVATLVVLDFAELLVPVEPDDTASMADTIPACNGRVLAQGLTYRFFDPSQSRRRRGPRCRDGRRQDRPRPRRRPTARSCCASPPAPATSIVGRAADRLRRTTVKFDDITTQPFRTGERSPTSSTSCSATTAPAAIDSRTFGPVLGNAIFAKVFAVYWPLRDIILPARSDLGRAARQDRLQLALAPRSRPREVGCGRASGHGRRRRRDPRGRRDCGRCRRRDGARLVRRRDGDERPPRRLPRDRVRRLARHEPRRLRRRSVERSASSSSSRSRSATSSSSTRSARRRARCPDFPRHSASSGSVSVGFPWKRLCEPALELARSGVPLPEMHARSLEMLGGLYSLERGGDLFTRDGRTLREGELLDQPGLVQTLEALAEEGAASVYRGSLAEALLRVDGVVLHGRRPRVVPPAVARLRPRRRTAGVASRLAVASPASRSSSHASHARRSDADRARARARRRLRAHYPRAASTRRTWSRSTRTVARACSRTRSASAPASGCPASTRS